MNRITAPLFGAALTVALVMMSLSAPVRGADFYLSPRGADSRPGTSPQNAWQSLARLQKQPLRRGDRVLLEGGATFRGSLQIGANPADKDDADNPLHLEIGSFGTGRAVIDAAGASALVIRDRGGIVVRDLIVCGDGLKTNRGAGLLIENTRNGGDKRAFVRIQNVEASGFYRGGILIASAPPDASQSGFSDVHIEGCDAHDNVFYGVSVSGVWDPKATAFSHQNVEITNCRAWNNLGDPEYMENHSGSGIIVGETDGGRVAHSEAWGNGALCNASIGGPVGIWTASSRGIRIDHNVSHGNRTGNHKNTKDGGGFDLDGGVSDSVMEHNLSYDNDGAGFMVYNYFDAPHEFKNNVVRFNTSLNDGRRNGYGGLLIGNDGKGIDNVLIENNVFITSVQTGATPAVIRVFDTKNVVLRDNKFLSRGVPFLLAERQNTGLSFQNNLWSADGDAVWDWYGAKLRSLEAFERKSGDKPAIEPAIEPAIGK